jgi:hypothetical protein
LRRFSTPAQLFRDEFMHILISDSRKLAPDDHNDLRDNSAALKPEGRYFGLNLLARKIETCSRPDNHGTISRQIALIPFVMRS